MNTTSGVVTVTATVASDGSAVVEIDGQPPQQLQADDLSQARQQAVALVIGYARRIGQPVALLARDSDTSHLLKVHPDGTVHPAETASPAQHRPGRAPRILAYPPTAHRPRPRWPVVAVAATSVLAVAVALWMRPTHYAALPTAQTSPGAHPTPTHTPVPIDKGSLGVTAAVFSRAPRRVPLHVADISVSWNSAATWQQRRLRQASRPAATWTDSSGTQVAPVQRPEAPPPPAPPADHQPAAPPPAAKPPARPQVIIQPDPAAATEPQTAPTRHVGPAMPDQPTNPANPN